MLKDRNNFFFCISELVQMMRTLHVLVPIKVHSVHWCALLNWMVGDRRKIDPATKSHRRKNLKPNPCKRDLTPPFPFQHIFHDKSYDRFWNQIIWFWNPNFHITDTKSGVSAGTFFNPSVIQGHYFSCSHKKSTDQNVLSTILYLFLWFLNMSKLMLWFASDMLLNAEKKKKKCKAWRKENNSFFWLSCLWQLARKK